MKSYKNLSFLFFGLAIGLIIMLALIVGILFKYDLIPFFSNTNNSIYKTDSLESLGLEEIKTEVIASGLEVPWSIVFPSENTILVTERSGRVRIIKDGILLEKPAIDLTSEVVSVGEAGLMSMELDPDFTENSYTYIYHTYRLGTEVMLKVVRYEYNQDRLINPLVLINDIPSGTNHSGGELGFGPDGKLYITTGDISKADLAQDLSSLARKTLKINKDGSIPNDNPFVNEENARDEIWSYGHRNAQGLDWHPLTFEMYQSEHGPSGFDGGVGQDEINLVQRGQNYGWPVIRGSETAENMFTPITFLLQQLHLAA